MEFDMDVAKAILLQVQAIPHGGSLNDNQITVEQNMNEKDTREYIRCLKEANFIEAELIPGRTPLGVPTIEYCTVYRLLNDGHKFLRAFKDESAVERGRKFLASSTKFISAELIRDLLRAMFENFL